MAGKIDTRFSPRITAGPGGQPPRTGGPLMMPGSPAPNSGGGGTIRLDDPMMPGSGSSPYDTNRLGGVGKFMLPSSPQSPPPLPGFTPQNNGYDARLNDVYDKSVNGSTQSFNTAANRLRERLDSSAAGMKEGVTNRNLSRGFGNSGANDRDLFRVDQMNQQAYGQGLNDLSSQFEDRRLQGLQTGLGAANSLREGNQAGNELGQLDASQLRNLGNSNYQFGASQDQQDRQFRDKTLYDLMNNREGRQTDTNIANLNAQTQTRLQANQNQFQSGQNTSDRQMQELLAQLQQQNENYRSSLGMGANQQPRTINVGSNGNYGNFF